MGIQEGRRGASEQLAAGDEGIEVAAQIGGDGNLARLQVLDLGDLGLDDAGGSAAGVRDGSGSGI